MDPSRVTPCDGAGVGDAVGGAAVGLVHCPPIAALRGSKRNRSGSTDTDTHKRDRERERHSTHSPSQTGLRWSHEQHCLPGLHFGPFLLLITRAAEDLKT
jgi:hypothetical protein